MSAAQHPLSGGVAVDFRIGQRVRHRDHLGQRITGEVRGLSIDSDRVLQADIVLDAPIVIPALNDDDREISIWHQHVPAHELVPFDDRDELIAELLAACKVAFDQTCSVGRPKDWEQLRAAIAKATGSPA